MCGVRTIPRFISHTLYFMWNLVTTLFSFPVLFQSSELSNHVFYNFIISLIHFTLKLNLS